MTPAKPVDRPNLEFTPSTLRDLADRIKNVHLYILLNMDGAGSDPEAENFFLLSMAALESAQRYMSLAAIKQSQGIAK